MHFLRLFSINNVPKQQFLRAKYYLDMFGYCLNNISNCFSAFSPVLSMSSYSLFNANNLNNAINISSSTSSVLSVGSKSTSSIYKPIGLLPYEVSDSLVVPKHVSLTDCLTTPNSFALRSRRHIDLKDCY